MTRFKIGDRVRVVSASGCNGRTGTVTGIQHPSADEPLTRHEAFELFGSYVVEFDGGQIEILYGSDLEAE